MFYYLYQITNNLNGKIYVGVHKTSKMDDGYMGSGKVIKRAIEKHGIDNFTKVILETFDNAEDMYAREKEVVTEEFLNREDVYNLRRGGHGGFEYINKKGLNVDIESQKQINFYLKEEWQQKKLNGFNSYFSKFSYEDVSIEMKRRAVLSYKNGRKSSFKELNKTKEFQLKRIKKFVDIGHAQGEKNSQYGTMWITNEIENKKIRKDETIPDGWRKGRKV